MGNLPANAPASAYAAISNPLLNALNNANMQSIAQRITQLNANSKASNALPGSSTAAPAYGSAAFIPPMVGQTLLIPTAQQIMSVLGPTQMLRMLNQIEPTRFSVTNIQFAPKAMLAQALNNLSYNDIALLMDMMTVAQRMSVYMVMGIPMGEALVLAEQGTQGLFLPTAANALSNQKKRVAAPIGAVAPIQLNNPSTNIVTV